MIKNITLCLLLALCISGCQSTKSYNEKIRKQNEQIAIDNTIAVHSNLALAALCLKVYDEDKDVRDIVSAKAYFSDMYKKAKSEYWTTGIYDEDLVFRKLRELEEEGKYDKELCRKKLVIKQPYR